jgi:two-component system phosphate regulon response regulator PhoB/two-component system alkaline phosphatase synthesis response regulator PhoP
VRNPAPLIKQCGIVGTSQNDMGGGEKLFQNLFNMTLEQETNKLIAVVDDEPDILELVSIHLKKAGFKVREFLTAQSFFNFIEEEIPELIILDLMLPDSNGLEICKYLKKKPKFSSIPIIMLTAKSEETDKIIGLELGADDYITKPFSPKELTARVKAVLRRDQLKQETTIIEIDDVLKIDTQKYEVYVHNKKVDLTSTEFKILKILAEKSGIVFSREQLLNHLWGNDKAVLDRTIDVHIKNLRDKLGSAGKYVKNIRGVGYKLED